MLKRCPSRFPCTIEAILFLLASCNAPRDNPLDPNNTDSVVHSIHGTVRTDSRTSVPIPDVLILWKNDGISVRTNSAGGFSLTTTDPADGWLKFEKDGFGIDSVSVHFGGQKSVSLEHTLDAIPFLDSLLVYTVVKNWYSQREYSLAVDATVFDDDDIDTVWVSNAELSISKTLTKISASFFQGRFYDYELPVQSLEEFIGRPLSVAAMDGNGRVYTIGSGGVNRIIQDEIELLSPINQDTVATTSPELRWRRFTPGFRFVYSIEIYTDEPEPVLVWSRANISSEDISITINPPISVAAPERRYFWVNWCIDEFNNRSRSKPASFIILPQ